MGIITGVRVAAAGAAAWMAVPLVDMGIRGTRDQQLRAEWRAEGARAEAERAARVTGGEAERVRRARARAAQVAAAAAYASIPVPREGEPARRSPVVGS